MKPIECVYKSTSIALICTATDNRRIAVQRFFKSIYSALGVMNICSMKLNMIKLDWLAMKYYWVRIIVLPVMICMMGFLNEALIIPMTIYTMLSFSVNPFAVEEKGKLDNLYLTLPVSRKTVVKARYGLSLILQFAGLIFGTIMTIAISALLYNRTILFEHSFRADFKTIFLLICTSLLFCAIMNLSMFPILFKIGYAKGKALGFYIPIFGSAIIGYGIFIAWTFSSVFHKWLLSVIGWALINTLWTAMILLAAAVFILAISYVLSQRIYAKREF